MRSFVFAGSSSVYGDATDIPMVEERIGRPLSPYAVTKRTDELYASVFSRLHGLNTIGLRYFNVFGERQDPAGDYAAVIPRWISAMVRDEPVTIYGDGRTTRDFCYVANVVQANIRAALAKEVSSEIFNVACGKRTSLEELFKYLVIALQEKGVSYGGSPAKWDFRSGDIRHSQADIGKAERLLGYRPTHDVLAGLTEALPWYLKHISGGKS